MPIHEADSDVWILKLTSPQVKDSGEYECQVSYHEDVEKKLTMPISLTVLGKRLANLVCWNGVGVSSFTYMKSFFANVPSVWVDVALKAK